MLVDLALRSIAPEVWLPGTVLAITGDAFVDDPWGESRLVLHGTLSRDGVREQVRVWIPAAFVDAERMTAAIDNTASALFGEGDVRFEGEARVEAVSTVDGKTYRSRALPVAFELTHALVPAFEIVPREGIVFPNEPLALRGHGLLLGDEGETILRVRGCFRREDADACEPIAERELVAEPVQPHARDAAIARFSPRVVGIERGRFDGEIAIVNRHRGGEERMQATMPCTFELETPVLYRVETEAASVGQYVTIHGAGFLGAGEGDTLLAFVGSFTPAAGQAVAIDELLLPTFVDGRTVRYVLDEGDSLGQRLDLRNDPGRFEGTLTPIVAWQDVEVRGDPTAIAFALLPVRQVIELRFLPAYTESLRAFGLRAVDARIRARVREVIERDFAGVNVEIREAPPDDFAAFARVDVGGPDPNGLGLLGYDNTPGKDTDNARLYDTIGGVNALTQEDGFPGYGGVFIESLFAYSEHPGQLAEPVQTDPRFDAIFDPFRPDVGARPVTADDLRTPLPTIVTADDCPAAERPEQIACAIAVLGNLVGTTVSHELGHSLGLADPYGSLFHNPGDAPDRLMDAERPFAERAELAGHGPSRFCAGELEYLQRILPTDEAPQQDPAPRPPCN